jgi:predicted ATPase/DNA-binding SARP family transcriptional activator
MLAGQVAIRAGGTTTDAAGLGRLGRLAFAYLVAERRRPVPRDELADVLWGDDLPRSWDTALRGLASRLRAWLAGAGLDGTAALTTAFGCLELRLPEGTAVDVEEAAQSLAEAEAAVRDGDPAAGRAAAERAAAIAGREFLPGATGAWVERRQAELREVRARALEALADAAAAAGDWPAALAAADGAVALDPLRETAHVRVMRAHAAAGNRGEALRAYERCRRVLAEELGVDPSPPTQAVYLDLLGTEPGPGPELAPAPSTRPVPGRTPDLPAAVSSLVGRDAEVASVVERLRTARLLTLVGPGGVGKTRLALEVARRAAPGRRDGARWVELGGLGDAGLVPHHVLATLGLAEVAGDPAAATLAGALAAADLVLVLDNCEHLVDAAADLTAALLRSCGGLTVLATGREPLGIAGEVVWPVPPLPAGDAARLFAERASAVNAGFQAGDGRALANLCRRLDGLPLAVELAAARTVTLSVAEIAARLDDRFRLLAGSARGVPARQATLRAAVDWSYDGLDPDDRALLLQVSVFAAPFTLDAAGLVAGGPDPLDGLQRLVSRSLVVAEPGTGPSPEPTRYRLLDTIRDYARQKLAGSPLAGPARDRLVAWAVALAEEAEPRLDGPEGARWLDRLEREHDNLRGALEVATARGGAGALRLAAALGRFWEIRGHLDEGRRRLRLALDADGPAPGGDPTLLLVRARALNAAGLLAQRQGDLAAARSRLGEALALRLRVGDRLGAAIAVHGLGNVAALQHDLATARARFEESLAIGRDLGDPALVAASLANLGWVAHAAADFPAARALYDESLALRRSLGDLPGTATVLGHLGDLAFQQGDVAAAAALHAESLALRRDLGDRAGAADSLATLGHVALAAGDLAGAGRHLEESLAIRHHLDDRAGLPGALCNLGDLAMAAGDLASARSHLEASLAAAAESRDRRSVAHALLHLGRLARAEGDARTALARYVEARRALGAVGPDPVGAEWLEGMGALAGALGDAARGARLLGAAEALRAAIGAPVPPHEASARDDDVAALAAALGAGPFEAAWRAGRSLDLAAALAEAEAVAPTSPG